MNDVIQPESVTVVTATGLEERAARRALPASVRVVRAGIGLSRTNANALGTCVVSCGLAGGAQAGVPTATVLIPSEVCGPDGTRKRCDEVLVAMLVAAARRLGFEPDSRPLFTSDHIVRGKERDEMSALGFAGIDMETALIPAQRLAAVRVVLDTPERELSTAWASPLRVLRTPAAWRELPWLAREAPRCAALAARIVAETFMPMP